MMPTAPRPSVNARAAAFVDALVGDAEALRLQVSASASGARLIDAGVAAPGGLEAGRRIAEIAMGGLGHVSLETAAGASAAWRFGVSVHASQPVLACLASQYAGWSLAHEGYHVLGSGPGRAIARREPLFEELAYADEAPRAVFVLEAGAAPPEPLIAKMAEACGLEPAALDLIITPTSSLAGGVQIVARALEVALHKAHELGFPLADIVDGMAAAPLPPPAPGFVEAMGRTNDAIIYGGRAHLYVAGPEAAAADLATRLPSGASKDYGRPFAEIFAAVKGDFYQIDPLLFSPAEVTVTALQTGASFHAGGCDAGLLERSFGG